MAGILMKGNEVVAEAAIRSGCRYFFGYPITPQSELLEYLASQLPKAGGVFLQAESEVAAINMVFGAAGAGARVMTSSSGPGISLKQEGISYIAAAELPCVIVNVMRGGPGLGGIQPSQSDYYQATRGGGHGDYQIIVLAPSTAQELADLTGEAFDLADRYRIPVMLLSDGMLGQMMEAVEFKEASTAGLPGKEWATTGCRGRARNVIKTLYLDTELLEEHNLHLQEKYRLIEKNEARVETYYTRDAEIILIAFGTTARIASSAVDSARALGIRAGMIRPVTLWPFPYGAVKEAAGRARVILDVEMNAGQMLYDVKLAAGGAVPVHFYGRTGGVVPGASEILAKIKKIGGVDDDSHLRQA